ncbi:MULTISPECIES: MinD/ParA family protein [unclassified Microbacterium]|uniref:MinD/ParA family protein n=1 Tax=unclassified Microbacterium TaxID=2609290 RepID=UPI00313912FF
MTPDRTDANPDENAEHGVLDESGNLDTASITILGGHIAQVNVDLPTVSDDDDLDDDVIEDEVVIDDADLRPLEAPEFRDSPLERSTEIVHEPHVEQLPTGDIILEPHHDEASVGDAEDGDHDIHDAEIVHDDDQTGHASVGDTWVDVAVAHATADDEGDAGATDAREDSAPSHAHESHAAESEVDETSEPESTDVDRGEAEHGHDVGGQDSEDDVVESDVVETDRGDTHRGDAHGGDAPAVDPQDDAADHDDDAHAPDTHGAEAHAFDGVTSSADDEESGVNESSAALDDLHDVEIVDDAELFAADAADGDVEQTELTADPALAAPADPEGDAQREAESTDVARTEIDDDVTESAGSDTAAEAVGLRADDESAREAAVVSDVDASTSLTRAPWVPAPAAGGPRAEAEAPGEDDAHTDTDTGTDAHADIAAAVDTDLPVEAGDTAAEASASTSAEQADVPDAEQLDARPVVREFETSSTSIVMETPTDDVAAAAASTGAPSATGATPIEPKASTTASTTVTPEPASHADEVAQAEVAPRKATAPATGTVPTTRAERAATGVIGTVPLTRRSAQQADEAARVGRAHALERVKTPEPEVSLTSKRLGQVGDTRESADLLTADRLLDPRQIARPEPEGLWRQLVYSVSGHRINLGDGRRARQRKELDRRISAPLVGGARFVPVLSRKGGVGKTTVTSLLGMALADAREDRIIAVDANPDRGTLADRVGSANGRTVRDLVRAHDEMSGYNDVSSIVARDATRLDVLASDTDPRVSEAFSDDDYRQVADVAAHYYSIVLTDTGTGIVHSVMGATLELADTLVIVAGLSVDEARLASETLTWLETNGYTTQVRDAVVVLNNSRPGAPLVRESELEAHFRSRVRTVIRMPYDARIAAGSAITFRELQPATRQAARELAAAVVEGLRAPVAAA